MDRHLPARTLAAIACARRARPFAIVAVGDQRWHRFASARACRQCKCTRGGHCATDADRRRAGACGEFIGGAARTLQRIRSAQRLPQLARTIHADDVRRSGRCVAGNFHHVAIVRWPRGNGSAHSPRHGGTRLYGVARRGPHAAGCVPARARRALHDGCAHVPRGRRITCTPGGRAAGAVRLAARHHRAACRIGSGADQGFARTTARGIAAPLWRVCVERSRSRAGSHGRSALATPCARYFLKPRRFIVRCDRRRTFVCADQDAARADGRFPRRARCRCERNRTPAETYAHTDHHAHLRLAPPVATHGGLVTPDSRTADRAALSRSGGRNDVAGRQTGRGTKAKRKLAAHARFASRKMAGADRTRRLAPG